MDLAGILCGEDYENESEENESDTNINLQNLKIIEEEEEEESSNKNISVHEYESDDSLSSREAYDKYVYEELRKKVLEVQQETYSDSDDDDENKKTIDIGTPVYLTGKMIKAVEIPSQHENRRVYSFRGT